MNCKRAPFLAISLLGLQAAAESERPNILFIASDDMKPLIGAYGDTFAQTPHLDRLAARGTAFVNAHCQWAVCGPSRASLMTSLMPETTGVTGFKPMRAKIPDVVTLPQYFRDNGYATAATGKLNDPRCVEGGRATDDPLSWSIPYQAGMSNPWKPAGNPPFAAPDIKDNQHEDGQICDTGLDLLEKLAKGDEPFFLGVGFKKPHLPFIAPKKQWDLYDRAQVPLAVWQKLPVNGLERTWNKAKEARGYDGVPEEGLFPEELQREMIHGYYACVSMVDAQVGRLLEKLDELGLTDNTIIVFWGDHGFHLGDHGDWGKHTNVEQGTRVPFIVVDPRNPASVKNAHPAGFIDLYPTLCELAGLDIPDQVQGRSLVPMLGDPDARVRNGIISLFRRDGMGYAYRTDRYRYIEWIKGAAVDARELYDYETDPDETENLAGKREYKDLIETLAEQMREDAVGCDILLKTK
ncbi:MAG: sulfatase [Verrucomicrobia bacterium]|nr:sulfatase [Verrucomicrobiota bacterium]